VSRGNPPVFLLTSEACREERHKISLIYIAKRRAKPDMDTPKTLPGTVVWGFFAIGLMSATAFRVLIAVQHFRPELFRPVWYFGLVGYAIFFSYRYAISQKRKKTVKHFELIAKLQKNACLDEQDRAAAIYLLSSIAKSKENINYLFIFILSVLAAAMDLLLIYIGR